MAIKLSKMQKKVIYDQKLCKLLDTYAQVLIVGADNVGSTQLQNIRGGLRGDSIILMGKNTMMKRSIKIHAEKTGNSNFLSLIPLLVVSIFFFSLHKPCILGFYNNGISIDPRKRYYSVMNSSCRAMLV